MTTLPHETQRAVLADLKEREQLKRFVKARCRVVLAAEFGHHIGTIGQIIKTGQARFLTPEQVAQLQRLDREHDEAQDKLTTAFSFDAIAERNHVGQHTVRRYYERYFQEQSGLPMCAEEFRRAG